jgi:hypothetical protein
MEEFQFPAFVEGRLTTHTPVRVTVVPTNDSCAEKLPEFEHTLDLKRLLDGGLVE